MPTFDQTAQPRPTAQAFARIAGLVAACLSLGRVFAEAPNKPPPAPPTLVLAEVLHSVTIQYPPWLAVQIERDIAAGRLRSARAGFDFNVFARIFGAPNGFYDSATAETGFEQFTGLWGSTIFGGYRLTRGDLLPDYDKNRTQGDGEPWLGLRLPLLRDGAIDRRRAALYKARIDQELANPVIFRQHLDFVRAATVSYYAWLSAGERLRLAEELVRLAHDRGAALTNQVATGLIPRIILKDNQRLVVARSLSAVQARRRFEAASLALSLFLRDPAGDPVVAQRAQLPQAFPTPTPPDPAEIDPALQWALATRPELKRLRLALDKIEVDLRLARNQLLPNLDASVSASQDFGEKRYKDKSELEVQVGVEMRVPLQRREAKGRVADLSGQAEQLRHEERFARDRIETEIRDAHSALAAAYEQSRQAHLNVELAVELQEAEAERFRRGASDLLALQIREQAAFDAKLIAVDALTESFRSGADFRAAAALGGAPPVSQPAP